ncbi:MAG: hypothetical protein LBR40_02755 [Bacilli bacterium]|jgi:hypothetical protein|nr:hypothetical protein [Bacilli bacterium]
MKKLLSGLLILVMAILVTGCGGSKESTDAFTEATAGTNDFETLQKGFAANGAWLNAITEDVDATGKTLTVDGVFSGDGEIARELALYKSNSETHKAEARYTLTVDKLIVNSPNFAIAQGTVKGTVEVTAPGFHFEGGTAAKIDGDLVFATDDLKTAYEALTGDEKGTVTGQIKVDTSLKATEVATGAVTINDTGGAVTFNDSTDANTGATAGTSDYDTLEKGLSADGAWLNAVSGNLDAKGKTLTVDGTFVGDGEIARELALYKSNSETHKPEARYTLTVDKLIVNSPNFAIAQGTVVGDVEVNAAGFHFEGGSAAKVQGNVTFKTQDLKDAYDKLPSDEKGTITGTVSVAK